MTITRRGIMKGSRRARITDGKLFRRDFTETHILVSDDGTDDEGDVYLMMEADGYGLGADWQGENGSTNTGVKVVDVVISDTSPTKQKWEVEVQYSSELPGGGISLSVNGASSNPVDWSPDIEWDTEFIEEVATRDRDGRLILNSAHDPPEFPPVTKRVPITVLRFSRWLTSYTAAFNLYYAAKTNSDNFLGFPADTGLVFGVKGVSHFIHGFQFWKVSFVIKFREDGWQAKSWDIGRHFLDATNTRRKAEDITTDNPFEPAGLSYVPLNSDGTARTTGEPDELKFDVYKQVPLTPITQ